MGENLGEKTAICAAAAAPCPVPHGWVFCCHREQLAQVLAVLCLTPSPKVLQAFFSPLSTICRSFPAINKSRGWLSKAPIVRHCSSKAQPLTGERRNAPFRGLEKRSRTEYSAIKSFCKPCSLCSSNRGQKVAQIF